MIPKQIGILIADLRNEKGITQKQLAKTIGVEYKTIVDWENGTSIPDLSVAASLCIELNIEITELLCAAQVNQNEFEGKTDGRLLSTPEQIKEIKHQNSINSFFKGAGTGLVIWCAFAPDTPIKNIVLAVGIVMIGISWYKDGVKDKLFLANLENKNK